MEEPGAEDTELKEWLSNGVGRDFCTEFAAVHVYFSDSSHCDRRVGDRPGVTEEWPLLVTKMSPYYDR